MSLGGPVLKQHTVEFIYGTGVVLDGVTINAAAGPWNYTLPGNALNPRLSGCGAGGGGAGGGSGVTAYGGGAITVLGGGGGGGSGMSVVDFPIIVDPGTALTVTVGAPGAGTAAVTTANQAAPAGGNTTIAGINSRTVLSFLQIQTGPSTTLTLMGGGGASSPGTSNGYSASGGGGALGQGVFAGGVYSNNAPAASVTVDGNPSSLATTIGPAILYASGGAAGGMGCSTVSSAGASTQKFQNGIPNGVYSIYIDTIAGPYGYGQGTGNTTGTVSRGAGGYGGGSFFGPGTVGANGGAAGANALGYGAGGAGGGGGAAGGNGSPGYVRITYWAAD